MFMDPTALEAAIQHKIDQKTKPQGALGHLEGLARQIAQVQGTLHPRLKAPAILVFAGDHGIADTGVSAYPPEVTAQMVRNFAAGGAAINVFCRQHGIALSIVDAGVRKDLKDVPGLIPAKVAPGTRNFLEEPAMTPSQFEEAWAHGQRIVAEHRPSGNNVLGFGEMGIGNTSSAALLVHGLTGMPLEYCTGRGTGLDDAQLERKRTRLREALAAHPALDRDDVPGWLRTFGGFEIVQMAAAMGAAPSDCLLLVDGFIATAAYLAAEKMVPGIRTRAVFCHQSAEDGHQFLMKSMGIQPLLQLGMRLGEGTGCALAYPLLQSAVDFFNDMAGFEEAGVSRAN